MPTQVRSQLRMKGGRQDIVPLNCYYNLMTVDIIAIDRSPIVKTLFFHFNFTIANFVHSVVASTREQFQQ